MPEEIKTTKRHLPHWTLKDSVYFITFRTKYEVLNEKEQTFVLEYIKNGHNKYYSLYSVIVMPDHAHMLIKLFDNYSLGKIMQFIKGGSSRQINLMRNSSGQIWLRESFDRIIRDPKEFDEKMLYMFNNPIKRELTEDTWTYHGWYYNEEIT